MFALPMLLSLGCSRGGDVVLLTIDTLRVDHVGAFSDSSPAQTPNIDSLAREGVSYTQAYSPISVTGPAFATLNTGKSPGTHGVIINMFRGGKSLSDEHVTLAERFAEHGYSTGSFVSGFTLHPMLGLDQGFDYYSAPGERTARRDGGETATLAMDWLWWRAGKVFLWYHTYDPHGPWDRWDTATSRPRSKSEKRRKKRRKPPQIPSYQWLPGHTDSGLYEELYARAVEYADEQIGRILRNLKESGRYDDALIVLTADHGESLTERHLWFDHGTAAYEEQLHVPLIIKYPQGRNGGSRHSQLVGLEDVAPTLLEALGLPPLEDIDGRSLYRSSTGRDFVFGESSHCKRESVLECTPRGPLGKMFSLRTAEHTLIRRTSSVGPKLEVYDRSADQLELDPLSDTVPDDLVRMIEDRAIEREGMSKVLKWPPRKKRGAGGGVSKEEDHELEILRQLGYVDD